MPVYARKRRGRKRRHRRRRTATIDQIEPRVPRSTTTTTQITSTTFFDMPHRRSPVDGAGPRSGVGSGRQDGGRREADDDRRDQARARRANEATRNATAKGEPTPTRTRPRRRPAGDGAPKAKAEAARGRKGHKTRGGGKAGEDAPTKTSTNAAAALKKRDAAPSSRRPASGATADARSSRTVRVGTMPSVQAPSLSRRVSEGGCRPKAPLERREGGADVAKAKRRPRRGTTGSMHEIETAAKKKAADPPADPRTKLQSFRRSRSNVKQSSARGPCNAEASAKVGGSERGKRPSPSNGKSNNNRISSGKSECNSRCNSSNNGNKDESNSNDNCSKHKATSEKMKPLDPPPSDPQPKPSCRTSRNRSSRKRSNITPSPRTLALPTIRSSKLVGSGHGEQSSLTEDKLDNNNNDDDKRAISEGLCFKPNKRSQKSNPANPSDEPGGAPSEYKFNSNNNHSNDPAELVKLRSTTEDVPSIDSTYHIGDALRHPSHSIPFASIPHLSESRPGQPLFVKRTSRAWTCARLVGKAWVGEDSGDDRGTPALVVDLTVDGRKKKILECDTWAKNVRLLSESARYSPPEGSLSEAPARPLASDVGRSVSAPRGLRLAPERGARTDLGLGRSYRPMRSDSERCGSKVGRGIRPRSSVQKLARSTSTPNVSDGTALSSRRGQGYASRQTSRGGHAGTPPDASSPPPAPSVSNEKEGLYASSPNIFAVATYYAQKYSSHVNPPGDRQLVRSESQRERRPNNERTLSVSSPNVSAFDRWPLHPTKTQRCLDESVATTKTSEDFDNVPPLKATARLRSMHMSASSPALYRDAVAPSEGSSPDPSREESENSSPDSTAAVKSPRPASPATVVAVNLRARHFHGRRRDRMRPRRGLGARSASLSDSLERLGSERGAMNEAARHSRPFVAAADWGEDDDASSDGTACATASKSEGAGLLWRSCSSFEVGN